MAVKLQEFQYRLHVFNKKSLLESVELKKLVPDLLITDSFKINSGNSATKRKQEEALSNNYRLKIHPHTLDFNRAQSPLSSPICTPSKRRVLGELQNSPLFRPKESPTIERLKKTPITKQNVPPIDSVSPLTSRSERKRTKLSKIARILDERSRYRMANKENSPISDTFPKMDHTESEMFLNMDSTEKSMIFSQTSKLESHSLHQSDVFLNRNVKEAHSLKRTNLSMFSKLNKIENESTTDTLFKMNTKEESLMFNKITNMSHSISVFSKTNKGHESLNSTEKFLKSTDDSLLFNKVTNVESNLTTMYSSSKDNELNMSETFVKLDVEEETRDCSFSSFPTSSGMNNWCTAKLDFTDALQSKSFEKEEAKNIDSYVPEKEASIDPDFDTLHDLEEEFDCANFDECSKYEIISTDSPNIISSGRTTSRKVHSRNFEFGAPLLENEKSTSFNRPNVNATRMLNFEDEGFEFTSPAVRKHSVSVKKSLKFSERHNVSVKKSLKFTETPTKTVLRHEKSDSSIGSMSTSPASTKLRIFPSESTMSMESGFISELEDPILDFEISNSPKMANFNELISGRINDTFMESRLLSGKINEDNQFKDFGANQSGSEIKDSFEENDVSSREIKTTLAESPFFLRRPMQRSLSFNAEALKARASLFSINESPAEKKNNKRNERSEMENISSKRRRSNCMSPEVEAEKKHQPRPVLQRAFSENNASIMSAMTRFETEPGLIGDFTLPFALPLTSGEHTDLNSISCDTLAQLLRGDYKDCISEFQVIDCRYPYEFEGGHIAGAVNLYTPELVQALVEQPRVTSAAPGRRILVFHCEFSRERGPKLSRFLRSRDRAKNKENYPSLHYPEVYLLHEGYRAFYRRYPELCSPAGYTAMLDPGHRLALKRHRSLQPTTGRRNRLLL